MHHLIPISADQVYPVVTVMETIEALLDKTYGKPIARNDIVSEEVIEGKRHITVQMPDNPYYDAIKLRPAASVVVNALKNGDLHGIIKIEGEGQFYRLPRQYWVGLDYMDDLDAFSEVPPNIRGTVVDPKVVGSAIMLAEKLVSAWLAGVSLPSQNLPETKRGAKRRGGPPKPDYYPLLQSIVAAHYVMADNAVARGRDLPFPTYAALAARVKSDSKGGHAPLPDSLGKHVKELRRG